MLKVLACSKQEYVGTGCDDVPSTGCDDVLVLWVVAKIPRHGLRRRAELCLEPGLPLVLDLRLKECAGHSVNGDIEAMITVIARVMDVWMFGCIVAWVKSDVFWVLIRSWSRPWGLDLENTDLDSSDNCFTLIVCFAMFISV